MKEQRERERVAYDFAMKTSYRLGLCVTRMRHLALVASTALIVTACGGGGGSASTVQPAPVAPTYTDPVVYSSATNASLPSAQELSSVTRHQLTLGSSTLAYTATAGHLTATHLTSGVPQASFFYVAYTLDNQNATTRPVTFFYNGGPGSASVWLHLGSFGPKRLAAGAPSTATPTPFALVDNAETLLGISDLVFVDAVGSGLSQAIAPNRNQTFWGVDVDAAVFRDFIRRYIAVNGRAASPKFLFGESYGATRSTVLANMLESAGITLSGVILQSSILDYNSNCAVLEPAVVSCGGFVPSYGATGAWYSLVTPNPLPVDLPMFLTDLRMFTSTQYEPAVASYLTMATPPAPTLVTQLFNRTGVAESIWQTRFNLTPDVVQRSLISGTLIGRYDARVAAPAGSALAAQGDPSSTFIVPSFSAAIASHLSNNLNYTNPSQYTLLSNAIQTWNFAHDGRALPDMIPDLAAAMTLNPRLKVLSLAGWHDLATPFHQTERDLARLGSNTNITIRNYNGGHMTYLDDASRVLQRSDLGAFYTSATTP